MRFPVICAVAASLLGMAGVSAHAATITFSSADLGLSEFVNDNDVQFLPFTVTESFAALTIGTDGYANLNGFDSTFAVFTSTGAAATDLLVPGGLGANINDATGLYDDIITVVVPAGDYILALTQYDNTPVDSDNSGGDITRADGFTFNNPVDPPVTDYTNPGGSDRFVDLDGIVNTGAFRVTLSTVAVPEAPSALLALPGLLTLAGVAMRRRNAMKGN